MKRQHGRMKGIEDTKHGRHNGWMTEEMKFVKLEFGMKSKTNDKQNNVNHNKLRDCELEVIWHDHACGHEITCEVYPCQT